jgi:class 3 adenylate cyclase
VEADEKLAAVLNDFLARIVHLSEVAGGDVLAFAGDAVLVSFDQRSYATEASRVGAAVDAALDMQRNLHQFVAADLGGGATLSIKTSITHGRATFLGVAGNCFMVGEPLAQLSDAESVAEPGRVCLSPQAAGILQRYHPWIRTATADLGCHLVVATTSSRRCATPADRIVLEAPPQALLDAYLPSEVRDAVHDGVPIESSLRQVTVGFVSLTSLTTTRVEVDPERIRRAVSAVVDAVKVHRGFIRQVLMDDKGLVVIFVFGIRRLSFDEDAALEASIAVTDAVDGIGEQCAVGVASGSALVGLVGSPTRAEFAVVGDRVNVAARLMGAATKLRKEGDGASPILCDEPTYRRAQTSRKFVAVPPLTLKGKSLPVAAFRVGRRRAADATLGALAPPSSRGVGQMVGRQAELAAIKTALAQALLSDDEAESSGIRTSCVVVRAPAGMGKSTLLREVRRHVVGWTGVRCVCLAADPIDRTQWLTANQLLASLGCACPAAASATASLVSSLVVDALDGPTIIVVEDAHWLDFSSWSVILALLEAVADGSVERLSLLLASRPSDEFDLTGSSWKVADLIWSQSTTLLVDLLPLDKDETGELLRAQASSAVDDAVVDAIYDRSSGVPLFSRELFIDCLGGGALTRRGSDRAIVAADEANLSNAMPSTVADIVLARVDRLPTRARAVVRAASVIGRDFSLAGVGSVVGAASGGPGVLDGDEALRETLRELEQESVIAKNTDDGLSYSLTHAMLVDAVRSSIPARDRVELHRAVAFSLMGELSQAELASHLVAAHEFERALPLLEAEAEAARYAHDETSEVYWLTELIRCADHVPEYPKSRLYASRTALRMIRAMSDESVEEATAKLSSSRVYWLIELARELWWQVRWSLPVAAGVQTADAAILDAFLPGTEDEIEQRREQAMEAVVILMGINFSAVHIVDVRLLSAVHLLRALRLSAESRSPTVLSAVSGFGAMTVSSKSMVDDMERVWQAVGAPSVTHVINFTLPVGHLIWLASAVLDLQDDATVSCATAWRRLRLELLQRIEAAPGGFDVPSIDGVHDFAYVEYACSTVAGMSLACETDFELCLRVLETMERLTSYRNDPKMCMQARGCRVCTHLLQSGKVGELPYKTVEEVIEDASPTFGCFFAIALAYHQLESGLIRRALHTIRYLLVDCKLLSRYIGLAGIVAFVTGSLFLLADVLLRLERKCVVEGDVESAGECRALTLLLWDAVPPSKWFTSLVEWLDGEMATLDNHDEYAVEALRRARVRFAEADSVLASPCTVRLGQILGDYALVEEGLSIAERHRSGLYAEDARRVVAEWKKCGTSSPVRHVKPTPGPATGWGAVRWVLVGTITAGVLYGLWKRVGTK